MGWLPDLQTVTQTQQALQAQVRYHLNAELGLHPARGQDATALTGEQWQRLSQPDYAGLLTTLAEDGPLAQILKNQLRTLLHYHGGQSLRTPQMLQALQQLSTA
jgi:hypothetical protein